MNKNDLISLNNEIYSWVCVLRSNLNNDSAAVKAIYLCEGMWKFNTISKKNE